MKICWTIEAKGKDMEVKRGSIKKEPKKMEKIYMVIKKTEGKEAEVAMISANSFEIDETEGFARFYSSGDEFEREIVCAIKDWSEIHHMRDEDAIKLLKRAAETKEKVFKKLSSVFEPPGVSPEMNEDGD